MSYVHLKHLLADLALEAVRHPEHASWAAVAAALADGLDPPLGPVLWKIVRERAVVLAKPFGWKIEESSVDHLVERGLVVKDGPHVTLPLRFAPHQAYFTRQTRRLLDVLAELRASGQADHIGRGAALFNGRLFFECHEYLEGVWKETSGPQKSFYHGLVQVAAAFYHFEKENWHGARTLLEKALRKLAGFPGVVEGVNLEAFKRALTPWMQYFADPSGRTQPEEYPRLELGREQKRQEAPRG